MRFVRLFIFGILAFALVFFIISLFIPSKIRVSRTIRIGSPKEAVMDELSNPQQWKDWYPGSDTLSFFYESGMIKGLILRNSPEFYLLIQDIKANEITAIYDKGDKGERIYSVWRVIPEVDSAHTTVQWYMDFHLNWYPWKKFSSLFYDKFYGSQMDQGLSQLKTVTESKTSAPYQ